MNTFSNVRCVGAALALLVAAALPVDGQAPDSMALIEQGRGLTRQLFAGDAQALFPRLSPELQRLMGGEAGIQAFATQVASTLGNETGTEVEEVVAFQGAAFYTRIARFEGQPNGTVTISWAWRGDTILTAGVRPTPQPAPSDYVDYQTKTALRLPFDDEFTVYWGGRHPHQNYHVVYPNQRFAYDLVIARDARTHTGDGTRNEDYYCFGRPILAPAAGVITVAVDTLPDNPPGEMTPAAPAGNHVIIDHGNGEYSLLAHLQSGSVQVSAGDAVEAGDTLAACGNSGNTSEPHLHYHLQDAPEFGPAARGMPAFFVDYLANDQPVERGEPVRGQRIRPRR
jgi:hypothetical protein